MDLPFFLEEPVLYILSVLSSHCCESGIGPNFLMIIQMLLNSGDSHPSGAPSEWLYHSFDSYLAKYLWLDSLHSSS